MRPEATSGVLEAVQHRTPAQLYTIICMYMYLYIYIYVYVRAGGGGGGGAGSSGAGAQTSDSRNSDAICEHKSAAAAARICEHNGTSSRGLKLLVYQALSY